MNKRVHMSSKKKMSQTSGMDQLQQIDSNWSIESMQNEHRQQSSRMIAKSHVRSMIQYLNGHHGKI